MSRRNWAQVAHEELFQHRYGVFTRRGCVVFYDNNFIPKLRAEVERLVGEERLAVTATHVFGDEEYPEYTKAWVIKASCAAQRDQVIDAVQDLVRRAIRACWTPTVWDRLLASEPER